MIEQQHFDLVCDKVCTLVKEKAKFFDHNVNIDWRDCIVIELIIWLDDHGLRKTLRIAYTYTLEDLLLEVEQAVASLLVKLEQVVITE